MKLTYQLQPVDLVKFNEYHSTHSAYHKQLRRKQRILVPIVYLLLATLLYATGGRAGPALLVFIAVLWLFLWPLWIRQRYRKHFQMHVAETTGDSLKDPIILELQDDGIHSQSYLGQSVYRYSAVGDIVGNENYRYVYIGKGMALVLPEDRIPGDQIERFVAEINERKKSANQNLVRTA